MNDSKSAVKAARLIKTANKIVANRKGGESLADLVKRAWSVFQDEKQQAVVYEAIWKDGVRTIQGILDHCTNVIEILERPGLNATARLAACWFEINAVDPDGIEGHAEEAVAHRLACAGAEYDLGPLKGKLPDQSIEALDLVWKRWDELSRAIAAGIEEVFDYPRVVRFYMLYIATIRRDEIAQIARDLRAGKPFTRESAWALFSGEGSDRRHSAWRFFESCMRDMQRTDRHGEVRC